MPWLTKSETMLGQTEWAISYCKDKNEYEQRTERGRWSIPDDVAALGIDHAKEWLQLSEGKQIHG